MFRRALCPQVVWKDGNIQCVFPRAFVLLTTIFVIIVGTAEYLEVKYVLNTAIVGNHTFFGTLAPPSTSPEFPISSQPTTSTQPSLSVAPNLNIEALSSTSRTTPILDVPVLTSGSAPPTHSIDLLPPGTAFPSINLPPPNIDSPPPIIDSPPPIIDSPPPIMESPPPIMDSPPPIIDSPPPSVEPLPQIEDSIPTHSTPPPDQPKSQPTSPNTTPIKTKRATEKTPVSKLYDPVSPVQLRSMYGETYYDHPFDVVDETFDASLDVLPKTPKEEVLRPSNPEAVIVTHDNRRWANAEGHYVQWFAVHNYLYARRHPGVHFMFYRTIPEAEREANSTHALNTAKLMNLHLPPTFQAPEDMAEPSTCPPLPDVDRDCFGPYKCYIYRTWCKVKVLRHALGLFPNAEYLMYLDSDALVAPEFTHISLGDYARHMETLQGFKFTDKPMVFGQELGGHGSDGYCRNIWAANMTCINGGVILLGGRGGKSNPESASARDRVDSLMERWWYLAGNSACQDAKPEGGSVPMPFGCNLKSNWPGEQPSMSVMYKESPDQIQVSYPDEPKYVWKTRHPRVPLDKYPDRTMGPLGIDCLAHYPMTHCFIQHFFAGPAMKKEESKSIRQSIFRKELASCHSIHGLLPKEVASKLCSNDSPFESPKWQDVDEDSRLNQLAKLLEPFIDTIDIV